MVPLNSCKSRFQIRKIILTDNLISKIGISFLIFSKVTNKISLNHREQAIQQSDSTNVQISRYLMETNTFVIYECLSQIIRQNGCNLICTKSSVFWIKLIQNICGIAHTKKSYQFSDLFNFFFISVF